MARTLSFLGDGKASQKAFLGGGRAHLICMPNSVHNIYWNHKCRQILSPNFVSLPIFWLLNLEWLSFFEYVVQYLLNTCLFIFIFEPTPNHAPLNYRCPIKMKNKIGVVSLMLSVSGGTYFTWISSQSPKPTNTLWTLSKYSTVSKQKHWALWIGALQSKSVIIL